ncbi:MAG: hypothetical protein ABJM11_00015 [Marinobacter sp.]|uniref:hypothetical protein n=1 Tax=Marinobacter sp. TaxID=50741 RepID=UPI0032977616
MSVGFTTRTVRVDQLVLSSKLPADYRRALLGMTYRVSSFSSMPESLIQDYIAAHPPVGVMDGKNFHVISNVRTLVFKPFLPGDTRIRVIVDEAAGRSGLEWASAQRELLNLMVFAMDSKYYAQAVAALWDMALCRDKAFFVSSKAALAQLAGLRRQSLSEASAKAQVAPMNSGGGQNG